MKRIKLSDVNLPDVNLPDVHLPSGPDVSGMSDSLLDLAGAAADAVSSAAGRVPGLDDYRASNRRRNVFLSLAAVAAVLAIVAIVRRRQDDGASIAQGDR